MRFPQLSIEWSFLEVGDMFVQEEDETVLSTELVEGFWEGEEGEDPEMDSD